MPSLWPLGSWSRKQSIGQNACAHKGDTRGGSCLHPEEYRKEAERIRQEAEKATGGERVTLLRMARMDETLAQQAEMLAALRSRHD